MSDAAVAAGEVMSELAKEDKLLECSEIWADASATAETKALLIAERKSSCGDGVTNIKLSCSAPQTGLQSLERDPGSDVLTYYRSTLYIKGASTQQKSTFSKGWSELLKKEGQGQQLATEDLR